MDDAPLLSAYAELRSALANPECPEGVKSACLSLSKFQQKLFCTVPDGGWAGDWADTDNAGTFDRNVMALGLRLEPSNFLRELLTALRALEWPRVLVLIHDATSDGGSR
jgi:hypothetical protein